MRGADRLRREHLRAALRPRQQAALHCFLLDCSASMLAQGRLALAKGVLAELMAQAYRWRDQVALLSFAGAGGVVRLPARRAMRDASAWVAPIGGGGGTPLTAALAQADELIRRHARGTCWLWLLTDGRSREAPARPKHADQVCIIDFDAARVPLGRAGALASDWGAAHVRAAAFTDAAAHWPPGRLWKP